MKALTQKGKQATSSIKNKKRSGQILRWKEVTSLLLIIFLGCCFFDFISTILLYSSQQLLVKRYPIEKGPKERHITGHMIISRERESKTCISEVQRVRLSRRSCIIRVLSLYESSPSVSSSAMASSKA